MAFKHLFGPVPSRRLGRSLGVDLVPYKVCSMDCVYCEVGKTTVHTNTRKEYVSTEEVIAELNEYLSTDPELDYITFSGAGEPTLHKDFGKIVTYIKSKFPKYKLALLTNSSLFHEAILREETMQVDLILPSLDAVTESNFNKINRPTSELTIDKIIQGLIDLSGNFQGIIWLEVFIIPGINDTKEELTKMKEIFQKIQPDEIQLNTLDRPGTESWVKPATRLELEKVKSALSPLPVTIIAKYKSRKQLSSYLTDVENTILSTIQRRPCTEEDLIAVTGLHRNTVNKYISELLQENKIIAEKQDRGLFFRAI